MSLLQDLWLRAVTTTPVPEASVLLVVGIVALGCVVLAWPVVRMVVTVCHEAGHAVAYAVLFGLAPLQLTARAAGDADGFTYRHAVHETSDSLRRLATVALAGGAAEELVFGAEHASAGRAADRNHPNGVLEAHPRITIDRRRGGHPIGQRGVEVSDHALQL